MTCSFAKEVRYQAVVTKPNSFIVIDTKTGIVRFCITGRNSGTPTVECGQWTEEE